MAQSNSNGPSKMELVRQALNAGVEKPTLIVDRLKEMGVEINVGQVSNYKSLLKNEKKSPSALKGRPGPKPKVAIAAMAAKSGSGYADKVARLKELVHELGAAEVKQLTDILA